MFAGFFGDDDQMLYDWDDGDEVPRTSCNILLPITSRMEERKVLAMCLCCHCSEQMQWWRQKHWEQQQYSASESEDESLHPQQVSQPT
jgi:hypothetical protein